MFRTPLCLSSGASQLHMQSLVPINYKNTCCLQICHYVERNNVNKILRILKQSTSSWRFYSSYCNDVRNHEPEALFQSTRHNISEDLDYQRFSL